MKKTGNWKWENSPILNPFLNSFNGKYLLCTFTHECKINNYLILSTQEELVTFLGLCRWWETSGDAKNNKVYRYTQKWDKIVFTFGKGLSKKIVPPTCNRNIWKRRFLTLRFRYFYRHWILYVKVFSNCN